jgi:predicted SAM-dependent methyltransferase
MSADQHVPQVVNLGCRKYCRGETCVDLNPEDPRVVKADAVEWLNRQEQNSIEVIYTKNLLEHLPDPGSFFSAAHRALQQGGLLHLITDNAEFLPFYAPVWLHHTGLGAHACNQYAIADCKSVHYMVFTKMHLKNLAERAGFKVVMLRRLPLYAFARLELFARAQKKAATKDMDQ